jgi:hypothetical protein
VLDTLKAIARLGQWKNLLGDLKSFGDEVTLADFLRDSGREPLDLYRSSDASWTRLRRDAGLRRRHPGARRTSRFCCAPSGGLSMLMILSASASTANSSGSPSRPKPRTSTVVSSA